MNTTAPKKRIYDEQFKRDDDALQILVPTKPGVQLVEIVEGRGHVGDPVTFAGDVVTENRAANGRQRQTL